MDIKKITTYAIVYALIVISVPVFFNSLWLKPMPDLEIYDGSLDFLGSNAMADIYELVKEYPERVVGSENAKKSARWIGDRFKKLGLDTYTQEFTCWSFKESDEEPSLSDYYEKVKGINVVGVSKGKSEEILLIGAHRDVLYTIEGAQDNATGTASMLELARVLTDEEHYYTYMFLSFDAEEIGLVGSEKFVKSNPGLNIKLALILDCVGYKNADTIGYYQFATGKGASPLWTVSLAQKLMNERNLPMYYLDEDGGFDTLSINTFNVYLDKLLKKRVFGSSNTDTGPFVDRSIPAIGFIAAKTGEIVDPELAFHTENDNTSLVSEFTLDRIGKFAEQYIRSVELNRFEGDFNKSFYVVAGEKYLVFLPIAVFMVFIAVLFIILWALTASDVIKNSKPFLGFLKKEIKWLVPILLISMVSTFSLMLLKEVMVLDFVAILFLLALFIIGFLTILSVLVLRFVFVIKSKADYYETTKYQRILLNTVYIIVFFLVTIIYNVLVAAVLLGLPIIIMGRMGFKNIGIRILWGVIFAIWSVIEAELLLICLQPYILEILTFKPVFLIFLFVFIWCTTFIYTVSSPAIPRRNLYVR
ncbi:MAG TPA: M28 family peptidase [Acetivibrio sp.]|nr:M28 family peptidase [Acetivibrio sp.]